MRRARQRLHDRSCFKKNTLKPHRREQWVIPPKANSAFVAAMEDVLAVYTRPRDSDCPLVCLDETSKQLIAETRLAIPMKPGRPARCDYEYERNGVANLFMTFAPLEGWRCVKVTDRHTAVDYAHVLKDLAETCFPAAKVIVLVQDNLNIHSKASLYEALEGLVQTRERTIGIARPLVGFQHVFHGGDEARIGSGGITHCCLRCGLRTFF